VCRVGCCWTLLILHWCCSLSMLSTFGIVRGLFNEAALRHENGTGWHWLQCAFGFMSCKRVVGAAEGMNLLQVRSGSCICIRCVGCPAQLCVVTGQLPVSGYSGHSRS
jgi:hypothetical protein